MHAAHGVLASEDADSGLHGFLHAAGYFRVGLEHVDARSVADDFDVDVGRAQTLMRVLHIAQRERPFFWIGIADLEQGAERRAGFLRRRRDRRGGGRYSSGAGGGQRHRTRHHGTAGSVYIFHIVSPEWWRVASGERRDQRRTVLASWPNSSLLELASTVGAVLTVLAKSYARTVAGRSPTRSNQAFNAGKSARFWRCFSCGTIHG